MDESTLAALRGSIAKWEAIVAGAEIDEGQGNCPLCLKFDSPRERDYSAGRPRCVGCPVKEATGQDGCQGSPYDAWSALDPCRELKLEDEEAMAAAKEELEFLRGLLPDTQ